MRKLLILLLSALVMIASVFLVHHLMMATVPPVSEVDRFLDTLPAQTGWKEEGDPYAGVIVSPRPRSWGRLRNLVSLSATPDREIIRRFTSNGRLVAITLHAKGEKLTKMQVSAPLDPLLARQAERLLFGWFPNLRRVF